MPTSTSTWGPGWGAHRDLPQPLLPSWLRWSRWQPTASALPPRCQQQKCPQRLFPPSKHSPEPCCEGQPARGEFKASSACESQGRFSPGERFPEEEACQEPQARRGLTTITKTSRTWLEIKRLPSLLSKTAGVARRAWAFSPSKHPPLLRPSEAPPCFHVSISAPSLLARKIQN